MLWPTQTRGVCEPALSSRPNTLSSGQAAAATNRRLSSGGQEAVVPVSEHKKSGRASILSTSFPSGIGGRQAAVPFLLSVILDTAVSAMGGHWCPVDIGSVGAVTGASGSAFGWRRLLLPSL